eukprot:gene9994-biopygen3759
MVTIGNTLWRQALPRQGLGDDMEHTSMAVLAVPDPPLHYSIFQSEKSRHRRHLHTSSLSVGKHKLHYNVVKGTPRAGSSPTPSERWQSWLGLIRTGYMAVREVGRAPSWGGLGGVLYIV